MPSDKEQRLPKHAGVSAGRPIESPENAETVLAGLASAFLGKFGILPGETGGDASGRSVVKGAAEAALPSPEDMYRVLVEQIPAVVFIAYIDRGSSEAYVSPQIESSLGFSQEEWLQDPIRWYERIHPDDKQRWSVDAAQMLVTSEPLKSAYRVIARDGRVVWFQCEVKMVRKPDGRPWFLHGVGFDITDLKQTEQSLQERTVELQHLSSRLLKTQDEEHRRIARELHDSLGQYLAALKMNLARLSEGGGKDNLAGLHYETEQIVDRCINETRTLSYLLHPPLLDEIGFVAAATWYAEGFAKRSGIKISLQIAPKLGRLPEPVELALFRILQETLTNIHRHSESASAEIEVGLKDGQITMTIRDYGKGMPADILNRFQKTGERAGVGLSGIRERVKELGGRVEISSDRDGTLVSVTLPFELKSEIGQTRD
jgi:PAS domain S-box-containing protein